MKALKEKRIRLRSLWRRGLVILSLFALVFASCSDSGSGGGGGGGGSGAGLPKTIVGATITKRPDCESEKNLYEGFPIKLDGIVVKVRYSDGTTDDISDPARFYMGDPYYAYYPTDNYNVYLANSQYLTPVGNLSFGNKIRWVREIHWHGGLGNDTYFSDDVPDLTGITLEMRYTDPDAHDSLYHKEMDIPREWLYWRFSQKDEVGQPFVEIGFPGGPIFGYGISRTAQIPLKEIHYVETLSFDPEPDFLSSPIYVDAKSGGVSSVYAPRPANYSASTPQPTNFYTLQNEWIKRLGADTKLNVTYTGTDVTRSYSVAELGTMRYETPDPYSVPSYWYVTAANPRLMLIGWPWEPLQGLDVPDGAAAKTYNNVDNKKGTTIRFAYRGIPMDPINVPIFGQYLNITAASADGEELVYIVNPRDRWPDGNAVDTLTTLGAKIKVMANYALYTDKGTTASREVKFNPGPANNGEAPGIGYAGATVGKYYDIATSYYDQWPTITDVGAKDKTYKLEITYEPDPIFTFTSTRTAKVSVFFQNVAP